MSLELLRAIARSELPRSFTDAEAVEGLRALRASGCVIGVLSEPGSAMPHGRVSIVTYKGWVTAYARTGTRTALPSPHGYADDGARPPHRILMESSEVRRAGNSARN